MIRKLSEWVRGWDWLQCRTNYRFSQELQKWLFDPCIRTRNGRRWRAL